MATGAARYNRKLLILTDINGLLFGGGFLSLRKPQEVITMKDVVDKCSTKGCAMSGRSLITRTASTGPRRCSREEAESTVAAVRERCCRRSAPASECRRSITPIVAAGDAVKLDLSTPSRRAESESFSSYPCEICFNSLLAEARCSGGRRLPLMQHAARPAAT